MSVLSYNLANVFLSLAYRHIINHLLSQPSFHLFWVFVHANDFMTHKICSEMYCLLTTGQKLCYIVLNHIHLSFGPLCATQESQLEIDLVAPR